MFGVINYWIVVVLMMLGFYIMMTHTNLIKKIIGLNIFQVSIFMFYISLGKAEGGTAPILAKGIETYSSPLPHVLILTAIVVSVATTALGLALTMQIKKGYDTIDDDEIKKIENT